MTEYIPTLVVRFKLDGGWRQGEVVSQFLHAVYYGTFYRVRDSLTGKYYDVPAADCIDTTKEVHSDE